ncbi:TonB-dependent receptor [Prevotella sp. 10(H)]|uniref:TonB-dependent receptor n=1 Tax=Prevotella sp. 10(H) TaxID=1158294 RepID=UPI0012DE09EA|nr:TonB-dependent receptor [Prevotella sp. 10(H)]
MKILILFLILGTSTCFSINTYSQTTKLSIKAKSKTLKQVFSEIERQSEFIFVYYDNVIDTKKRVSIDVNDSTIDEILNKLFESTDNTYEISGRQIVVSSNPKADTVKDVVQDDRITVKGNVTDMDGNPLIGVTIFLKENAKVGTVTDTDGNYSIDVPDKYATLTFKYIGFIAREEVVGNRKVINVILQEDVGQLEEVVVVGFGTQKKQNLTSAITTVRVKELKGPTSNLTTMLTGRIAGVISYQRSGEPGQDNSQFFVRGVGSFGAGKVNPLILIDGIESSDTDLARLQPDDISDFSVLKDAVAAAVYGARGANGVILVNTKQGIDGKTKFNFRVENSISTNTRNFKLADNITYMQLANEAYLTRIKYSGSSNGLPYSMKKIDRTKAGENPYLYPSNDWMDLLIEPRTMNQRINLSAQGGGLIAKYYVAGTFNIDNGILKNDKGNNFDNNIKLKNYSIRSNTTLQLTRTTEAVIRVYGQFDDYEGPVGGGGAIFNSVLKANPVAFTPYYPASYSPYKEHILFGNALMTGTTNKLYKNPYAQMVSGYQMYNTSTINAQIELNQNFDFILPGLSARGMGYVQRYSKFASNRSYNPFFYKSTETDGNIYLTPWNDGGPSSIGTTGTEYLSYNEDAKEMTSIYYGEAALNYNHTFSKVHAVSGMLIGTLQNTVYGNPGSLEKSLPHRNLGLSGRASYAFDSRYFVEFNFGYNGSERFAKNNRWGFFPSVGVAWNLSNESFFSPLKNTISNLKFRASYGLVGNDQIGKAEDRFFYLSNVDLNYDDRGYRFGTEWGYHRKGININRYPNVEIGWEESRQTNIGMDISAFGVEVIVDAYRNKRDNILMQRTFIPGTLGLTTGNPYANIGKAESEGIDIGITYNKAFGKDWWTQSRANFTYATNEIKVYDEPNYPASEWYRTRVGQNSNRQYGFIAERLFIDDDEVANSPTQTFGSYHAGDIKYRDINGDGVINDKDKVPIGHPTTPEIIYGFGGTVGYKDFDLSFFFQGSARSSFFIDPGAISPFVQNTESGEQNGLLRAIADDHWSEDNRNLYAFWPRLSLDGVGNNNQTSTWWMRNGSFLRLKTLEVGYTMPEKFVRKIGISDFRLYLNASNLFVLSNFKMWDPEMGGNGLGYPLQRVYNIGISFGI